MDFVTLQKRDTMASKKTQKRPPGRPREHDRDALLKSLLAYIEATEIPIVAEWAASQGIPREEMYRMPELSRAMKLCITKKEGALERAGLENRMNVGMAIMSLKQIGWSDRQRVEVAEADVPVGLAGFYAAIGEPCDGDS